MLLPRTGRRFDRDAARMLRRGKDGAKLQAVIDILLGEDPLEPRHRDHKLKGSWTGYRECHVEPDWLLVYKVDRPVLRLERTGTTPTCSSECATTAGAGLVVRGAGRH